MSKVLVTGVRGEMPLTVHVMRIWRQCARTGQLFDAIEGAKNFSQVRSLTTTNR